MKVAVGVALCCLASVAFVVGGLRILDEDRGLSPVLWLAASRACESYQEEMVRHYGYFDQRLVLVTEQAELMLGSTVSLRDGLESLDDPRTDEVAAALEPLIAGQRAVLAADGSADQLYIAQRYSRSLPRQMLALARVEDKAGIPGCTDAEQGSGD